MFIFLQIFSKNHLRSHLVKGFSLLAGFLLLLQASQLLLVCLDFFLHYLDLLGCMFLRIFLFLPGYLVCGMQLSSLLTFHISEVSVGSLYAFYFFIKCLMELPLKLQSCWFRAGLGSCCYICMLLTGIQLMGCHQRLRRV